MKRRLKFWTLVFLALFASGYAIKEIILENQPEPVCRSWSEIVQSDTLRVVTVPSSISAFYHKGSWRGHEYEMARQVAVGLGLNMQMLLAPSERAMLDSLRSGVADLAAWPVFYSVAKAEGGLRSCGYTYEMGLVPITHGRIKVSKEDLARYTLAVPFRSRSWLALQDSAVATGFNMVPFRLEALPPDSITAEHLSEMVAKGLYDMALVPNNLAALMRSFYREIEVGKPLEGSEDSVSWVVHEMADTLAAKIDSLCHFDRNAPHYAPLVKRYYEQSRGRQVKIRYLLGNGHISVYDALFRKYAKTVGWDWRLLAAVAYVESRFDPLEESAKGARGLMQLMPATGERFGCPEPMLTDPESNIQAGSNLIRSLETSLRSRISRVLEPGIGSYSEASDETRKQVERDLIYFTLASYNAGLGHVFDAIALADTLQLDPGRWRGNVEYALTLKADSAYYNLPCVRTGRFNATVTLGYVDEVLDAYALLCTMAKE
ncbi:MAG: transglycosylase SLT domain-containing protein [Bacteroidales bacterium]|nr:transglycosylase SLT domain-containing protein [Bacteroidales bacterium]